MNKALLLNLSLMAPCYLVSMVAMTVALGPDVWLWLIPLTVSLFSVVFGITMNLRSHSFHWEREETVVKQSLSAIVGGFAGPLLSLLMGVLTVLTPDAYANITRAALCIGTLALTAALYRANNRTELRGLQ